VDDERLDNSLNQYISGARICWKLSNHYTSLRFNQNDYYRARRVGLGGVENINICVDIRT
jgi:hypothetical protein